MIFPQTLSLYITRRFGVNFVFTLGALLGIVYLFEVVELLRRATGRDLPFGLIIEMSIFKLPQVGQQLFSFAVLFSAILTFWRLTRTSELVVARAAGVSVWQFLIPLVLAAALIGAFRVGMINPLSAIFIAKYESLERRHLEPGGDAIDLSESGLWLRERNENQAVIIHARHVDTENWALKDLTVLVFDKTDRMSERIDAEKAVLQDGDWHIGPGKRLVGETRLVPLDRLVIPTDLTREKIENSFASPESLSFWRLPGFIAALESTGFSAVRMRMHFQSLLAQPLLYGSLILLAASVGLRPQRRGRTALRVGAGIGIAFALFFMSDVAEALGLSGTLPPPMAAWTPAAAALLLGTAALLHLEDG